MSSTRVTAIVVSYNGGELLFECIAALLKTTYHQVDVLVVDNASADRACDDIAMKFGERISTLRLATNRGFAGGVNAAIRFLDENEAHRAPDIYALVNQDCIVEPGWLGPMVVQLTAADDIAAVGARIYDPDGVTLQHAGGLIRENGMTDHIGRGSTDPVAYRRVKSVDYVTGALFAFTRYYWEKLGPFDESFYPAYYEEVDYCWRARSLGLRSVYVPESVARHHEATSTGNGSDAYLRHYHRNRMRFLARHHLRRGRILKTLAAEADWLFKQRDSRHLRRVLGAYANLPAELVAARRSKRSEIK